MRFFRRTVSADFTTAAQPSGSKLPRHKSTGASDRSGDRSLSRRNNAGLAATGLTGAQILGNLLLGHFPQEHPLGIHHRQPRAIELVHARQQDAQMFVERGRGVELAKVLRTGAGLTVQVATSYVTQRLVVGAITTT